MTAIFIRIALISLHVAITLFICHYAKALGSSLQLLDHPVGKAHALHDDAVPLVGGIAVFLPMLLMAFALLTLPLGIRFPPENVASATWFFSSLAGMLFMGVLDDRHQLSVRLRLLCMILLCASIAFLPSSFTIQTINLPLLDVTYTVQLGLLSGILTILCLVALINAANMADGRNGLLIGMGIIWTVALIVKTWHFYPTLIAGLTVSLGVVLVYNLRGKLFMGDGGAYALAFSVGLLAIWAHNQDVAGFTSAQVGSLFIIPVLDMARLICDRMRRGHSPMAADHDHLHHRLERRLTWRYGLPVYLFLVAAPIALAFSGPQMGLIGLLAAGALYALTWHLTREHAQAPAWHGT